MGVQAFLTLLTLCLAAADSYAGGHLRRPPMSHPGGHSFQQCDSPNQHQFQWRWPSTCPAGLLDDANSPEWRARRFIQSAQRVSGAGCEKASFLVATPRSDGFASVMITLAWCLQRAMASGQVFTIDPKSFGNYGTSSVVYHKLFKVESGCPSESYAGSQPIASGSADIFRSRRRYHIPPAELSNISQDEWLGHVLRWLMRPTVYFGKMLDQIVEKIGFPSNKTETVIGVHIRRGDKIRDDIPAVPVSRYISTAVELAKSVQVAAMHQPSLKVPSVIFIATDALNCDTLLAEATSLLARIPSVKLRVISNCPSHLRRHSMAKFLATLTGDEKLELGERATLEIASDLLLLAESDYLIGTSSSTVSGVASHLRLARYVESSATQPHLPIMLDLLPQPHSELWTDRVISMHDETK
jgi:hypothetical protein